MRRNFRNYGKRAQGGWWQLAAAAVSAYGAYRAGKQSQDFARDMSGTAHQREVADLRAAGLNPILSGTGGMGAVSPPAQFPNMGDAAVSSGMGAERLQQELRNMESGERLNHELANQARQTAVTSKATAFREEQQGRLADSQRETTDQLREFLKDKAKWDASSARWLFEQDKAAGQFEQAIGSEARGARLLLELMRGFQGSARPR